MAEANWNKKLPGAFNRQPENINTLDLSRFRFVIHSLPFTEYFTQSVNVPGINQANTLQPTPLVTVPITGDHLSFDPFMVTFLVDEDMKTYLEIYDWLRQLTFPTKYSEFGELDTDSTTAFYDGPDKSDATLMVLTNASNPNIQFFFHDVFPTSLTEIQFNSAIDSPDAVTATATFEYTNYEVIVL